MRTKQLTTLLLIEFFLLSSFPFDWAWAGKNISHPGLSLLRPKSLGEAVRDGSIRLEIFQKVLGGIFAKDAGGKEGINEELPEVIGVTPKMQSVLLRNPKPFKEIGAYEVILPPLKESKEEVERLKRNLRNLLLDYTKGRSFDPWLRQLERRFGILEGEFELTQEELDTFKSELETLRQMEEEEVARLTDTLIRTSHEKRVRTRVERDVEPGVKNILTTYLTGGTEIEGVHDVLRLAGIADPKKVTDRANVQGMRGDPSTFNIIVSDLTHLITEEFIAQEKGIIQTEVPVKKEGPIEASEITGPLEKILLNLQDTAYQGRRYDLSQVKADLIKALEAAGLHKTQATRLLAEIDLEQQARLGVRSLYLPSKYRQDLGLHRQKWFYTVILAVVEFREQQRRKKQTVTLEETTHVKERVFGFLMKRIKNELNDQQLIEYLETVGVLFAEKVIQKEVIQKGGWAQVAVYRNYLTEITDDIFERLLPHIGIITGRRLSRLTESMRTEERQLGKTFLALREKNPLVWGEWRDLFRDFNFQIAWVPNLPTGAELVTEIGEVKTLRLNQFLKEYLAENPRANLVPLLKLLLTNVLMVKMMKEYDSEKGISETNDFIYDVVGFQSVIEEYEKLKEDEREAIEDFREWHLIRGVDPLNQFGRQLEFIKEAAAQDFFDIDGIVSVLEVYFYYSFDPMDVRLSKLIYERNHRLQNLHTLGRTLRDLPSLPIPTLFAIADIEGDIVVLNKVLTEIFSQFGFKKEIERRGTVTAQLKAQGLSFEKLPPFQIIFIGDVLGKSGEKGKEGTTQLETLERVKELVEADVATLLMGGNEYTFHEAFLGDSDLTAFWMAVQKGDSLLEEWERTRPTEEKGLARGLFRRSTLLKTHSDWIKQYAKLRYYSPIHLFYFVRPGLQLTDKKDGIDLTYEEEKGIEALEAMERDIPDLENLKDLLHTLLFEEVIGRTGWEEEAMKLGLDKFYDLLTLGGLGSKQVGGLVTYGPFMEKEKKFFRIDLHVPQRSLEEGMGFFQVDQNGIHLWKILGAQGKIVGFKKETRLPKEPYLKSRLKGTRDRIDQINKEILKAPLERRILTRGLPLTKVLREEFLKDFNILYEGFNVDDEGNLIDPPPTSEISQYPEVQKRHRATFEQRFPEAIAANILINRENKEGILIIGSKGIGVSLISKSILESKNSDFILGADNTTIVSYTSGTFVGGTRPLIHIAKGRENLFTVRPDGSIDKTAHTPHEEAAWITKIVIVKDREMPLADFLEGFLPPRFRQGLQDVLETKTLPVVIVEAPIPPATLYAYQKIADHLVGSQDEIGQRVWTLENEKRELISVYYKLALLKGYFEVLKIRPARKEYSDLLSAISWADHVRLEEEEAKAYLGKMKGQKLFEIKSGIDEETLQVNETLVRQLDERRRRFLNLPLEGETVSVDAKTLKENVERLLEGESITPQQLAGWIGRLSYEDSRRFAAQKLSEEIIHRFKKALKEEIPITQPVVIDPENGRIEVGGYSFVEDYEKKEGYASLFKRRGMNLDRDYIYGLIENGEGSEGIVVFKKIGDVPDEIFAKGAKILIERGEISPNKKIIVPGWEETDITLGEFAALAEEDKKVIEAKPGLPEKLVITQEREWLTTQTTVTNRLGLHLRPSSRIATVLNERFSNTEVRIRDFTTGSDWKDAKDIGALLTLAAEKDHELIIQAKGPNAEEAIKAVRRELDEKYEPVKDGGTRGSIDFFPWERILIEGSI